MPRSLCESCVHVREVRSPSGSTFLRCGLSDVADGYVRYPRQPMTACPGHARNPPAEWEHPLGLFGLPLDLQVYRFLWMRSFHPPIVVRVERSGDTCTLFVRQADRHGGHDTGELSVDRSRPMAPDEWDDLERRAADSFWPLPTEGGRRGGFDGATWLVEARRHHKYHVVSRWSPGEGDPFREFCLRFIELAGLTPDPIC